MNVDNVINLHERVPGLAAGSRLRGQMDFGAQLGKLERTLRWLDRHQVEVVAFACSTMRGARVHARGASASRLRQILGDETNSRGHRQCGASRFEQWEARDPSTGVLVCWEVQIREGHVVDEQRPGVGGTSVEGQPCDQ